MRFFLSLVLAHAAVPMAAAHYFFPRLIVNGNVTGTNEYVRQTDQKYMPFKNPYKSTDLRCNNNSMQYAAKTKVHPVNAGDTIGFRTNSDVKVGHPGPMQVYLSRAPGDVREYEGDGKWFKIWETGPVSFSSSGIEWSVANQTDFTFTLPKETPAGQYLVRIEHIALHLGGDFGDAEFYFECAQIDVASDSTATPGPLVDIPGIYDGYEPGIAFNLYWPKPVNYTMPGPAAWPQPFAPLVSASGISVTPKQTPWTFPAVTQTLQRAVDSATIVQPSTSSSESQPQPTTFSTSILSSKLQEIASTPAPAATTSAPPKLAAAEGGSNDEETVWVTDVVIVTKWVTKTYDAAAEATSPA